VPSNFEMNHEEKAQFHNLCIKKIGIIRMIPRIEGSPSRFVSSRTFLCARERERERISRREDLDKVIIVRSKSRARGRRKTEEGEARDVCALHK